jgi:hypothetical protein
LTVGTRVLLITGSMGSGKTTVMGEASDLLTLRGIAHAAIDVDALANGHFPVGTSDGGLKYRNLRSLVQNYSFAGVKMFLVAEAIESRAELECLREAAGAAEMVVCRLRAELPTMQQRVRVREPGLLQQKFVERAAELDGILDRAGAEDFSLTNDEQSSVSDVATEMLVRAGWLAASV